MVEIKNLDEYCIRYHSPESLESLDHLVRDRIKVVDINIGNEEEEEDDELIHPLFRRRWDQPNDEEDEHLQDVRSPAAETKNLANNDDIQLETSPRQSALMTKLGDTSDKQSVDAKENGRKPSVIPQPTSKVSEVQKEETQRHPSPLSGFGEPTVLRTRVKSVVEMMTTLSSSFSTDREAGERRHTIQQEPSLAASAVAVASSVLESSSPAMMKGLSSTTVVTNDSKAKSMAQKRDPALPASPLNFDGDAVPAKPPRLLTTAANHELENEITERQKNIVTDGRSSRASNSVNSSSKACSRSLSLVDSSCKASRSLSLVDSSTSPYSSEPEDQGGGDETYVWPSPDQFTSRLNGDGLANKDDGDEGGTGFNGGEKWSYLSGT